MRRLRSIVLTAALALPVLTCDTYTGIEYSSLTRTYLTDSPFPYYRVDRVDLWIVSVQGSIVPDTSAAGNANFVTLASPNRRINVLALQNGLHEELGAVRLPIGTITAVRMVIDTDSSSITLKDGRVLKGNTTPGIQWQSSAGRPTLNALINEDITVPDLGGLVVIDYDVGQAFIPPQEIDPSSTDSGFIFSPVLRAVDANKSGWVEGVVVRPASLGGTAVVDASLRLYFGNPNDPENTWSTLGTAKSASDGRFRFASVTRTAYWSNFPIHDGKTYIVAADPPPNSGLGRNLVTNVTVFPAVGTNVGAIVLP